ncbi:MAG: S8 family serine peptidase [Paludibacteraceae bacterium]|nr:S8 family serine peptidase [Paludibacteraceae bacterium]
MKKRFLLYIFTLLCIGELFANGKVQQSIITKNDTIYVIDNNREYKVLPIVTVKYIDISLLQTKYQVIRYNKLNYADIEISRNSSFDEFVSALETDENISSIDYNSEGTYNDFIPNDEHWNDMWHLNAINVPQAWVFTTGSPSIKVAVLDSGTDWEHPDLGKGSDLYQNVFCNAQENDWASPNNPNSGNHIDDDLNSFVDDYKGWNFDLNSNDSRGSFYHGTFVAGIIGAKTNNDLGISGIAGGWNSRGVSIIPYCVGMDYPNSAVIDDAIIAAVDNGARIIQFSLSCMETNSIKAALLYAKSNNVLVVCASGNESYSYITFPASDTTVVAVGAINQDFERASISNYGSNLRLVAPGEDIHGLNLSSESSIYRVSSGTSFAAPQVSGVMALMLSINPDLTREEIIDIIESTAQKVGGYSYTSHSNHPNGTWNIEMGYGLVDAYAAVLEAKARLPLQGPDIMCDTAKYYLKNQPLQGETVTWSVYNGSYDSPVYSIVGSNSQDTVLIACTEYELPAKGGLDSIGMVDKRKYLSVTISSNSGSNTYTKSLRHTKTDIPTISASSFATLWLPNTTRTFTITNCIGVPDSLLQWTVKKIIPNHLPSLPPAVVTNYYYGRTLTYTSPNVKLGQQDSLNIYAINLSGDCGPAQSNIYQFVVSRQFHFLSGYVDGGQLVVSIYDESDDQEHLPAQLEENCEYTLEIEHSIYGRMAIRPINNAIERLNISALPQGIYILSLKANGCIIAQTKVQI